MRICKECQQEKEESEFYPHPSGKDGLNSKCKQCTKNNQKKYYKENTEKCKKSVKKWSQDNRDKKKNIQSDWKKRNKDYVKQKRKIWNILNKEIILFKQKEKRKIINYYEKYGKKRYKETKNGVNGELCRVKMVIFGIIHSSLRRKGYTKRSKTREIIGCSYEELLLHLGPKPEGNYHLDHICPCSQAQNEEELIKLQYYTNLRWLSAIDNLTKSDSWTPEGEELCNKLLNRDWIYKV
jgi:hypothetical protein